MKWRFYIALTLCLIEFDVVVASPLMEADTSVAILHIYRPKNYLGSASAIKININGTNLGKIKNGSRLKFRMKSEGALKIECSSASPKEYHSVKLVVRKGDERFIRIFWTSAYTFQVMEPPRIDGAAEFFNNDLFKGNEPDVMNEVPDYPIRIFQEDLETTNYNRDFTKVKSTGSGFVISTSGYVVTNYHVIEDQNKIIIRNINGDPASEYTATPIVEDRVNDLAILAIEDEEFKEFNSIPFILDPRLADVGESVFTLGYPLMNTMGSEVKLTNGIVSSKTGFSNNIITYQISVPVQPGNSGGPLFDKNGNLIGIVSAVHTNTDNVSYAIKSNYLVNLINLLPSETFGQSNVLQGKSLTDQVKTIEKYVVQIEVY